MSEERIIHTNWCGEDVPILCNYFDPGEQGKFDGPWESCYDSIPPEFSWEFVGEEESLHQMLWNSTPQYFQSKLESELLEAYLNGKDTIS